MPTGMTLTACNWHDLGGSSSLARILSNSHWSFPLQYCSDCDVFVCLLLVHNLQYCSDCDVFVCLLLVYNLQPLRYACPLLHVPAETG